MFVFTFIRVFFLTLFCNKSSCIMNINWFIICEFEKVEFVKVDKNIKNKIWLKSCCGGTGIVHVLTWQRGSAHALCCCRCSQPAAEIGAVAGVAAVYWADEAGSCAVDVAVHRGAPGAPQGAVPVAVARWWRALEAGVPQTDGGGFGLTRGQGLPQMSGNVAQSGGQEMGYRRMFFR